VRGGGSARQEAGERGWDRAFARVDIAWRLPIAQPRRPPFPWLAAAGRAANGGLDESARTRSRQETDRDSGCRLNHPEREGKVHAHVLRRLLVQDVPGAGRCTDGEQLVGSSRLAAVWAG